MKVYGKCESCSNEIGYSTSANTRVEFAMKDGDYKNLKCLECGNVSEIQVDQLFAKPSKIAQIGAGLIFLVGTPLAFLIASSVFTGTTNHYVIYIVGGFLLVPVYIYIIINKQDQTRVSDFNRRKLKGRVHNL